MRNMILKKPTIIITSLLIVAAIVYVFLGVFKTPILNISNHYKEKLDIVIYAGASGWVEKVKTISLNPGSTKIILLPGSDRFALCAYNCTKCKFHKFTHRSNSFIWDLHFVFIPTNWKGELTSSNGCPDELDDSFEWIDLHQPRLGYQYIEANNR